MSPKVSIIIPVYNVEKYLEECMESVVSQTLRDIEIICINDGATDRSPEILRKYAARDSRISLIDKVNEGYGIGMNIGIDHASGEFIGIVEPDDFVPPDMFEGLYRVAADNCLDFVKADFFRFKTGPDGRYEKTLIKLSQDPGDYHKVFDPSSDPDTLRFVMNTWCGIYRRSFLLENHIRHNTTPGASFQDTGFWIQTFIYAHRAMLIDTPYYMNRRDNPGSSVYDPEKIFTMNKEFDFIRDSLERDPEIRERFKYVYWRAKYYAYRARFDRISRSRRPAYLRRMRGEFLQGMASGEIDLSIFSPGDRRMVSALLKSPVWFRLLLFREYLARTLRK